jgi:phosphomannomutase
MLGVMISASHNPHQDNGIKFFGPDGFKLSDAAEAEIEAMVEGEIRLAQPRTSAAPSGSRTGAAAIRNSSRPASRRACGWTG